MVSSREVRVLVERSGQASVLGRLLRVRSERIDVAFAPENNPRWPIAEEVWMRVTGGPFEGSLRSQGRLLSSYEAHERWVCAFSMPEDKAHLLRAAFNLRHAMRVHVNEGEQVPVELWVEELDLHCEGILHDFAVGGLSVVLASELDERLCDVRRLRASVRLPGGRQPIEVCCGLRHRRLHGSGGQVLWGLSFEEQGTEDLADVRSRVGAWVQRRQLALVCDHPELRLLRSPEDIPH